MASMLSLLDVLPRHERVDIGGDQEVDVFGISGEDIGKILERYPDAFQQMVGSGNKLTGLKPSLLGALLAASQRNGSEDSLLGDEKVEKRARSLSVGAQMKMLQALGRCTFPDGIGPFLEDLVSISSVAIEATQVIVRAGSKVVPTVSQPMPKPLEQHDILASGS